MLSSGNELLQGYVAQINLLKAEIEQMEGKAVSQISQNDKDAALNFQYPISQVNSQSYQNSKLQKELSDLITEKAQTQQTIMQLEEHIGSLEKEHSVK